MDRNVIRFFTYDLIQDASAVSAVIDNSADIPDDDFKRSLSGRLDSILSDIANIRNEMES